jgi:hypothetical protein
MRRRTKFLLITTVLLGVAGLVLWRVTMTPPSWYRPPDVQDAAVADLAEQVEYRLVEQTQKVRPRAEQWSLRVRENQINSWLAVRLPKWIAHQGDADWASRVGTPQVRLEPGVISVAVPLLEGALSRTVVVSAELQLTDGTLHARLSRVALGGMSLPGERLANLLRIASPLIPRTINAREITSALQQLDGTNPIDPVFRLSDGRRVRMLQLRIDDGLLEFTAETLAESGD